MLKNVLVHSLFIAAVAVLSGCAAMGVDTVNESGHREQVSQGNWAAAAQIACDNKDVSEDGELDDANLLSTLKAGNALLYAKDYDRSVKMLDEAEAIIKYHREAALTSSTGDYLAKIALNDAAVDYQGTNLDAVMANTYKAIDYMILGRGADARIELNRAVDRQRRAKEEYAELIAKQNEALEEQKADDGGDGFAQSLSSNELDSQLKQNYSNLEGFQAYPDFVNPFTTYLAGLYFMIEGDYSKSSSLLKEAYGMSPQNSVIESDFAMVEGALSGQPISENYVWVIYENGLGPVKTEFKINIPMYMVSSDVLYTGIALPQLEMRSQATPYLSVLEGVTMTNSEVIADMDRVFQTEFKYTYMDVVSRAVLSAFVKSYAQYLAKENGGSYGGYFQLALGAFQALTTHADTRIWSSMPKDFQVVRVKMPENHQLQLQAGLHKMDVKLADNAKHSVVYVRIPTAQSMPSVSVANF